MIEAIVKGLALGFVLSISVGPVIFSIIKRSLTDGHKPALYFVAGVSVSDISFVMVANLFSAIFQKALQHQTIIAIGGSIFLLIMGIYTAFFKKPAVDHSDEEVPLKIARRRDLAASFMSGYLMNTLNPGAFLFWFAWSAAILASSLQEPNPLQYRYLVFGTCLFFVLCTDVAKVMLAGKLRSKLTPANLHLLDRISGFILLAFGTGLLYLYLIKPLLVK
ncbi:MAG: LysE family translocator [Chitinophagaceae bacterium]